MFNFKKLSLLILLSFSFSGSANDCLVDKKNHSHIKFSHSATNFFKVYQMYTCTLRPFTITYTDVAILEKDAREKAGLRCRMKEGSDSPFCNPEKAECTEVEVRIPQ